MLQLRNKILLKICTVLSFLLATKTLPKICKRLNLCLHPTRYILFKSSIRRCGRIIDKHSWRFDAKSVKSLKNVSVPTNDPRQQQFF